MYLTSSCLEANIYNRCLHTLWNSCFAWTTASNCSLYLWIIHLNRYPIFFFLSMLVSLTSITKIATRVTWDEAPLRTETTWDRIIPNALDCMKKDLSPVNIPRLFAGVLHLEGKWYQMTLPGVAEIWPSKQQTQHIVDCFQHT